MRHSFPLGRLLGVSIRIHWTFILVALWFTWWGRAGDGGGWSALAALGLLAAIFTCVVLHELGHSLVAIRFGARVESITLLPIGGVAFMRWIHERPVHELLMALAGPAVNVLLAMLLWLARGPLEGPAAWPDSLAGWLDTVMRANLVMALFNLVPAFPMDGGRVLRSVLGLLMSHARATRVAAILGQVMALVFIVLGWRLSPMLALIGFFVYMGAGREDRAVQFREALRGLRVRDAMATPSVALHPGDPVSRCREMAGPKDPGHFVVEAEGRLVGLVSRADWTAVLKTNGLDTPVETVVHRHFLALHPDAPLARVYEELGRQRQPLFPVIENGRLVGLLVLSDIERLLARRHPVLGSAWEGRIRRPFMVDLG